MENMILKGLFFTLIIVVFIFLFYIAGRTSPLFKMRCDNCGCKNKNWTVVPTAHQEFAWQHKCIGVDKV